MQHNLAKYLVLDNFQEHHHVMTAMTVRVYLTVSIVSIIDLIRFKAASSMILASEAATSNALSTA